MGCQLGKAAERWALLDSGNCGELTGRGRAQLWGRLAWHDTPYAPISATASECLLHVSCGRSGVRDVRRAPWVALSSSARLIFLG